MSIRKVSRMLAAAAVLAVSGLAHAGITVNWTGPNSFDDETMTFSGFQASSLTSTEDSTGFSAIVVDNNFNGSITWAMDIRLDGTWTNVFGGSLSGGSSRSLVGLSSTDWGDKEVTGIRFTSSPDTFLNNYRFANGLSFTFATAQVPEPASLALVGLGLLGVGFSRRKKV